MIDTLTSIWLLFMCTGVVLGLVTTLSGLSPAQVIHQTATGESHLLWACVFVFGGSAVGWHILYGLGWVNLTATLFASPVLYWSGLIGGSFLCGAGLALARMDMLSATVRIGMGDMAALTFVLLVTLFTWAASQGILSPIVALIQDNAVIHLAHRGVTSLTLTQTLGDITGLDSGRLALITGLCVGGSSIALALIKGRLWRDPLRTGACLVICASLPVLWGITATEPVTRIVTEAPYFMMEPIRLLQAMVGNGPYELISPVTGLCLAMIVSGILILFLSHTPPFPETPKLWRLVTGSLLTGLGGILAQGGLISHATLGVGSLALPSVVCVSVMLATGIFTARAVDR